MSFCHGQIADLVELVKLAVAKTRDQAGDPLDNAIRANVAIGVDRLKGLEPILAPRITAGAVKIVGGIYNLQTGRVTMVN